MLSYLFPAGAQRGTTADLRVGGLYLHDECGFAIDSPAVVAPGRIKHLGRVWFEGAVLPLAESQQPEDYPLDMAARVSVAADAPPGVSRARVWTSQGAAGGPGFVVGDLPEVVESELPGDPVPVAVSLPVTANGRVFPREDLDVWAVSLKKGQSLTALAVAGSIGTPLVPRLEVLAADGTPLAESSGHAFGSADSSVRFVAPADGTYHVRIGDARNLGGPAYVYRLTLTTGPVVDAVFPLGGRRGSTTAFTLTGQAVPDKPVPVALPKAGPAAFPHRLDLDDLPEHLAPPVDPVAVPAVLNGRIASHESVDAWPVRVEKGKRYTLELRARELGSPLCGAVAVTDASGTELARADAGADVTADPTLTFQAKIDGVVTVRVAERFRGRGGPAFGYRLRVTLAPPPDFRLTFAADSVIVPRGGTAKLKVAVERTGGFNAPLTLTATGLPDGVTVPPVELKANQNTGDLTFAATADAKVRVERVTVTGIADVDVTTLTRTASLPGKGRVPGDDAVSLAVAVPTPFKFDGDYTLDTAPRGQLYRRAYRLDRGGFDGPVTVRLADRQGRHLQGMSAAPVVVPAGETRFEFAVALPPWADLGRTCRGTLMASGVVTDPDGTRHTVSFSSNAQNHQVIIVAEPGRLALDLGTTAVRATPGATKVGVRIGRAKGLAGPVVVALDVPAHWTGVAAEPLTIPADRDVGELVLRFAAGAGPLTMPATVRATLAEKGDPVVALADLEILPPE